MSESGSGLPGRAAGVLTLGALLVLSGCVVPARAPEESGTANRAGTLRVATLNVHYISPRVAEMAWEPRRQAVIDVLRDADADIVAFQEMETFRGASFERQNIQRDDVAAAFPGHRFAAEGDPEIYPSTQPILYRADRLGVLEQGFFFFSPTPDVIYSRPWHKRFPAFASWVRFEIRGFAQTIVVVNVHFDASSLRNRLKSARLVAERIDRIVGPREAVIVAGDFNAAWFQRPVQIVARAGLTPAATKGPTYHFNRGIDVLPAIDHVLVSSPLIPVRTRVDRRSIDGVWPSDHYPVVVDLMRAE